MTDRKQGTHDKVKIRSIADLILEVSEPPGGLMPELFSRYKPPLFLALGLLERCRLNLRGMCVLSDADLEHAGAGVARGVMEYSVTGSWLLRAPKQNLDRFLQGQRHELERLVKERPEFQDVLDAVDSMMDNLVGHHDAQRLNDVASRMGPFRSLYYQYRLLSERAHPTFVATMLAFDQDPDDGNIVLGHPGPDQDPLAADYLYLSVLWTWHLAAELFKALKVQHGTLMAAGELLQRYTQDPVGPLMTDREKEDGSSAQDDH